MTLLLQTPFTMCLAGSTSSGKTTFVRRLLDNLYRMTSEEPGKILYCYGAFQPLYEEIKKDHPDVTFIEGLPCRDDMEQLASRGPSLVVLDDLLSEVTNSRDMQSLFTRYSHHRNISVIFVSQNIFFGGKYTKTINLNTHYLVLFKNPNLAQIKTVGHQLLPGRASLLSQAFEDATSRRYGYLFVDMHPNQERDLMLRSRVFPGEDTVVYQMKKH